MDMSTDDEKYTAYSKHPTSFSDYNLDGPTPNQQRAEQRRVDEQLKKINDYDLKKENTEMARQLTEGLHSQRQGVLEGDGDVITEDSVTCASVHVTRLISMMGLNAPKIMVGDMPTDKMHQFYVIWNIIGSILESCRKYREAHQLPTQLHAKKRRL